MSWTDERVELLKSMWNEGKSASQIAKALGGVTRNAVIGKIHRLGLSNRTNGAPAKEEAHPAAPSAEEPVVDEVVQPEEVEAAGPQTDLPSAPRDTAVPRPATVPPGQPTPAAVSEVSAEALANLAMVEKKARRLTLMQLTERTCKWPIGDPATDQFWFCGLPPAPGKPYCEAHAAIAFQPMSSRRDRRAGGR